MKRWQALLAMLVLFAVGVASGGLGAHLYYARSLARPAGPPGFMGPMLGHRLESALDLTPAQARRVAEILADSQRRAEGLRGEIAPRLREIMEDGHRQIRELLTPEQQRRFDELRARHRGPAERFFRGPPGPHGPRRHRPPPEPPA